MRKDTSVISETLFHNGFSNDHQIHEKSDVSVRKLVPEGD